MVSLSDGHVYLPASGCASHVIWQGRFEWRLFTTSFVEHCIKTSLIYIYNLFYHICPGLSICLIWGRNSAPFPMQNSIFFSQFRPQVFPIWLLEKKLKKRGKKNDKFERNSMWNRTWISISTVCLKKHVHLNMLKDSCIMDNKMSCYFFQILSKTPLFFPIPRAPGPSPKRGCESPAVIFVYSKIKVSIQNKREFHSKIFRKLISFSKRGRIKIRIEKLQLRDFWYAPFYVGMKEFHRVTMKYEWK